MALKMIGGHLMPYETKQADVVPQFDIGANSKMLERQVDGIGKTVDTQYFFKEEIVLAPKVQMPVIFPTIRNLSDGTIIPRMDPYIPVETLSGEVISSLPVSVFSPAPTSILGIGSTVGAILIMIGKAVVAEIAADVSMDTLQRIGQRVKPQYRIRGRTGQVKNDNLQQATTQVKPELGRSGFLPNRKHYDGSCEWWEIWCWIV